MVIRLKLQFQLNEKKSKSSVTVSYNVDGVNKTFNVPVSLDNSPTRVIKLIHRLAAVQKLKQLQNSGKFIL